MLLGQCVQTEGIFGKERYIDHVLSGLDDGFTHTIAHKTGHRANHKVKIGNSFCELCSICSIALERFDTFGCHEIQALLRGVERGDIMVFM